MLQPQPQPAPSLLLLAGTLTGVLLLAATLLCFPAAQFHFYPQCPIHLIFGIECPGCGSTRAYAALLSGHLREALRLNALTVCALPVLAAGGVLRCLWPRVFRALRSPALVYAGFAVALLFTVARNL